jgi:uncharacterized membrane protein YphA (DoxX/SURF4 family)
VSALTHHEVRSAHPLRTLGATICALASFAIFAHHGVPTMDMHGVVGMTETCVSVAAHVSTHLAPPAALLLAFASAVVLIPVALRVAFASRPIGRARAGPSELRIPLRC